MKPGEPPRRLEPVVAPIKDEDDVLTIRLTLASGKFESTISIPLASSSEAKRDFIEQWLKLMEVGLKCSPARESSGV